MTPQTTPGSKWHWRPDARSGADQRGADQRAVGDRRSGAPGTAAERAGGFARIGAAMRTTPTFWLEIVSGGSALLRGGWTLRHAASMGQRPALVLVANLIPVSAWALLVMAVGLCQWWVLASNRDSLRCAVALLSAGLLGAILTAYALTEPESPIITLYATLLTMQLVIAARATPMAWRRGRGGS